MPRLCCEAGVQQQGPGAGRLLGMQRDGAGRTAARVTLPNLNPTLARARSRSTSRWRSRHCSSWARCSWATSRWCTWTTGASRRPFLKPSCRPALHRRSRRPGAGSAACAPKCGLGARYPDQLMICPRSVAERRTASPSAGCSPASGPRRRVSLVAEEFLRMLHACGMPAADADMIHGGGKTVGGLLMQARACRRPPWSSPAARGRWPCPCVLVDHTLPGCMPSKVRMKCEWSLCMMCVHACSGRLCAACCTPCGALYWAASGMPRLIPNCDVPRRRAQGARCSLAASASPNN